MKRSLFLIALSVCTISILSANDRAFLFDETVMSILENNGKIVLINREAGSPIYTPVNEDFIRFAQEKKLSSPDISIETIYYIPIERGEPLDVDKTSIQINMWRTIKDIESLVGIQYYSERRKEMSILYVQSKIIEESIDTLSNNVLIPYPRKESARVLQEDKTFGVNTYRYNWYSDGNFWAFSTENETRLSAGLIPAINAGGLVNITGIFYADRALILYVYTELDTAAGIPKFMTNRILVSLTNRTDALKNWFETKLTDIFPKKN